MIHLQKAVVAGPRTALEATEEVIEHRVQSEVVFLVQPRQIRRNEAILAKEVRLGQVESAQK